VEDSNYSDGQQKTAWKTHVIWKAHKNGTLNG
jgi:hypothetical protein